MLSVVRCIGFAAFLAMAPSGPLGTAYLWSFSEGWPGVLWAVALSELACSIPGLLLRRIALKGIRLPRRHLTETCAATIAAAYIALCAIRAFGIGAWAAYCAVAVLGAACACFMFLWFEELLDICQRQGITRCVALLAACQIVSLGIWTVTLVAAPNYNAATSLIGVCVGIFVSWLCHKLSTGRLSGGPTRKGESAVVADSPHPAVAYHLTPYSVVALIGFGVTYAVSYAALLVSPEYGIASLWIAVVVAAVACCVSLLYYSKARSRDMQFGLAMRVCLTLAGCSLAALPVLAQWEPVLLQVLCTGTFILQGVTMIMFSIIMCYEMHEPVISVIPVNFAVFAVSDALACIFCFNAFQLPDSTSSWNIVSLLAVVATLAVVPFLPSRSSKASTFSLDVLPENQSIEERAARSRARLIEQYGLSTREGEVLDLILQGKSRQQIAEELSISAWTVRDHTSSIYSKTGVHSAKELMALAGKGV